MKKKLLTIVGARPQFVKAAVVSRALIAKDRIEEIIVHTGQHFDKNMSDVFFEEMEIPQPTHHLNINSLRHGAMTGRMLEGLEKIMIDEKPDAVMVYGDTNSTLAGALAAEKLDIKVIHVEAGLRSYNRKMPEEINRILSDRISEILYCPTQTAIDNLESEGYRSFGTHIELSGDVMQDAALYYAEKSADHSSVCSNLNLKEFVLSTFHRAENTDDPELLGGILSALNEINRECRVVVPIHPRTKKMIEKFNLTTEFTCIDPVGYFDMIELLKNCRMVLTDSGGLQKEAYFFGKHTVVLREQTEWKELVSGGYAELVGADGTKIISAFRKLLSRKSDFNSQLYGNGKAGDKIAESIAQLI